MVTLQGKTYFVMVVTQLAPRLLWHFHMLGHVSLFLHLFAQQREDVIATALR